MIRCITIDCRQSEKFIIKDFLYKNKVISFPIEINDGKLVEKPVIINNNVICDNVKDIWPLLLQQEVQVYCPNCNESYYIHTLIDGYNKPMAIFDTDNLCSCGGEIFNDVDYGQSKSESSSENWDGDQRKAPLMSKVTITNKCEKCGKRY